MTGIVNTTGARTGAVGTTVGTVGAADLSGVLPVGVTGGSGLTALGTVTSGNLSHADIVYPDGQILQVVSNGNNTQVGAAYNTEFVANCFCDITIKDQTSNLLVFATVEFYQDAAMRLVDLRIEVKTADTSGRSATVGDYYQVTNSSFYRCLGMTDEGFNTVPLQLVWNHNEPVDTVKNLAVTVWGVGTNGAGNIYNNNASTGQSRMTIFEITGDIGGEV